MSRRSVLFTPGDRPEMMRSAPESGADVVVFDLEDAIALSRRSEAREAVRDVLSDPEFDPECEVCIRVTPLDDDAEIDLDSVCRPDEKTLRLDAVFLPKAESAADVDRLAELLENRDLQVPIIPLIESARGVLEADAIADAEPTDALVFGAEDFAASVGATRSEEGTEVLYARERVVVAAAAAEIDAIDTLYTKFEDLDGLRRETEFAIDLGYDGKLAIHPAQIDVIHEAFVPDDDELSWARAVLDAKREADGDDRGVFRVEGEMIDEPLLNRARRIVSRSDQDERESCS